MNPLNWCCEYIFSAKIKCFRETHIESRTGPTTSWSRGTTLTTEPPQQLVKYIFCSILTSFHQTNPDFSRWKVFEWEVEPEAWKALCAIMKLKFHFGVLSTFFLLPCFPVCLFVCLLKMNCWCWNFTTLWRSVAFKCEPGAATTFASQNKTN